MVFRGVLVLLPVLTFILLSACSAPPDSQAQFDFRNDTKKPLKLPDDKDADKDLDDDDDQDDLDDEVLEKSLWAFGGMYSTSGASGYNNPATGAKTCPEGYTSTKVLGSSDEDAELFYCRKTLGDNETALYEFGGLYGFHADGSYKNPYTGAATCPTGFQATQVFGDGSIDKSLYFCARNPSSTDPLPFGFGGFFGYGRETDYKHPLTNALECPTDHEEFPVLGSTNVDWPLYFCGSRLGEDDFFPVDPAPDVSFGAVFDRGLAAFGGMYSTNANGTLGYINPATGALSCPAGYTSERVYGTGNIDWNVFICFKSNQGRFEQAVYDFGGMWGQRLSRHRNPYTDAFSCPAGFQAAQITGLENVDWPAFYCYRPQLADRATPYSFGGLYSNSPNGNYPNPLTGAKSCPTDHQRWEVLDHPGIDYHLFFCGAVIDTGGSSQ